MKNLYFGFIFIMIFIFGSQIMAMNEDENRFTLVNYVDPEFDHSVDVSGQSKEAQKSLLKSIKELRLFIPEMESNPRMQTEEGKQIIEMHKVKLNSASKLLKVKSLEEAKLIEFSIFLQDIGIRNAVEALRRKNMQDMDKNEEQK